MRWTDLKKSNPFEPISPAKLSIEYRTLCIEASFEEISLHFACDVFLRGIRMIVPSKGHSHLELMSEKQRSWLAMASSFAEAGKS